MANIFDYLKWRGDLTFTQDPPNAVDALVNEGLLRRVQGKGVFVVGKKNELVFPDPEKEPEAAASMGERPVK